MRSTIQEIFQEHFPAYQHNHVLPSRVIKAGRALVQCRTSRLGGHIQRCPDGHVQRVWYNSCKHRACPVCAFMQVAQWVRRRVGRLLHCAYYHTIFTLPWELNALWACNRRLFTHLLFTAAWQSLKELLADPRHLGALPGAIASFHSWTQTLAVHPHLHVLITGGGMDTTRHWRNTQAGFLLPSRVLSAKFRGKFLAFLRQHIRQQALALPSDVSLQRAENLLNRLGRVRWHVMIMPPYSHGRGVLQYLGRYVRGGPVSSRRVTRMADGSVRLRYKDPTRTCTRFMTLAIPEFMKRMLRHVPEPGLHLCRVYGLFAPGKRPELNAARALLGQLPVQAEGLLTWQTLCAQAGPEHPERCPVCGKLLQRIDLPPSGLSPPCPIAA